MKQTYSKLSSLHIFAAAFKATTRRDTAQPDINCPKTEGGNTFGTRGKLISVKDSALGLVGSPFAGRGQTSEVVVLAADVERPNLADA